MKEDDKSGKQDEGGRRGGIRMEEKRPGQANMT